MPYRLKAITLNPLNVDYNTCAYYYWAKNCCIILKDCNCNYILFTKLPWPGGSEGIFRSSGQASTSLVFTTHGRGFSLFLFSAERPAGKLWIAIFKVRKLWILVFIVFGLDQSGIEFRFTFHECCATSLLMWNIEGIKPEARINFGCQKMTTEGLSPTWSDTNHWMILTPNIFIAISALFVEDSLLGRSFR